MDIFGLTHNLMHLVVGELRNTTYASGYVSAIVNLETGGVEGRYSRFDPGYGNALQPSECFVFARIPEGFSNREFAQSAVWRMLVDEVVKAGVVCVETAGTLRAESRALLKLAYDAAMADLYPEEDWFTQRLLAVNVRMKELREASERKGPQWKGSIESL